MADIKIPSPLAILGATAALIAVVGFTTGKHHLGDFTNNSAPNVPTVPVYVPPVKTTPVLVNPDPVSIPPVVPAAEMNLTYGTWTLHQAIDDARNDWSNSVFKITSQEKTADGLRLAGYFEWRIGITLIGREYVAGNYVASGRLVTLEGSRVEQVYTGAEHQLTPGSYSVKLSEDGRSLLEGSWGSVPNSLPGVPGHWEAQR